MDITSDVNGTYIHTVTDPTDLETTTTSPHTSDSSPHSGTSHSHSMDSSQMDMMNNTQTLDETQAIEKIKKNLGDEEEFRPIDHQEPIHIFLKVKPLSSSETLKQINLKLYEYHLETGVSVCPPSSSCYAQKKQTLQTLTNTIFQYSYVFREHVSQTEFFRGTIYPCFDAFFKGENLLIFSYGVTNSGKTYTMQGTHLEPGLIPRTLDFLFETIKGSEDNVDAGLMELNMSKYRPDKFNEIVDLTEAEIRTEMAHKQKILGMPCKTPAKGMDRSESHNTLNNLDNTPLFSDSKKFGSLDSLSTIADLHDTTTFQTTSASSSSESLTKISLPSNKRYAVWISFYELYNDNVFDLLTIKPKGGFKPLPLGGDRPHLKVREDANKVPFVEGLTYVQVDNTREAIRILRFGEKNLQKSSNSINLNSSRSHAIFCLKIVALEQSLGTRTATVNQLSFCDLAGLERNKQTEATGKTAKEASNINQSLSSLSRCINIMISNQKTGTLKEQIPYRDNKLTRLFQAYFEGRGMVKMIVNFNPSLQCFDESVGVLKFAAVANQMQISMQQQNNEGKFTLKIEDTDGKNGGDVNEINSRLTVGWDPESECRGESDEEETDEDDESGEYETDEEGEEQEETMECENRGGQPNNVTEYETDTDEETDNGSTDSNEDTNAESSDDEEASESGEDESGEDESGSGSGSGEYETDSENEVNNLTKSIVAKSVKKKPVLKVNDMNSFVGGKKNLSVFKANDTMANKRKSIMETMMSKEQLIEKIKSLQLENERIKSEQSHKEGLIRKEIVGKWSSRAEEAETYWQNHIQEQRKQVEDTYLKRMNMMERMLERKRYDMLDELRQEKEEELENCRQTIINTDLELRKFQDENKVLKDRIGELTKLKQVVDELPASTTITFANPIKISSYGLNDQSLVKGECLSQSRFDHSLKLEEDEEEEDEDEEMHSESDDSEGDDVDNETQFEDSQFEETQYLEFLETVNETLDESELNANNDESVLATMNDVTVNRGVEMRDGWCQSNVVEVRNVEVACDLSGEEIAKLNERLKMKNDECVLVNDKFLAKVDLIEQMTSEIKHTENEHTIEVKRITDELDASQQAAKSTMIQFTALKTNHKLANTRFDHLEKEHNQMVLEFDANKLRCDQTEVKLVEAEKCIGDLKGELEAAEASLMEISEEMLKKETEIKQLEDDVNEHGIALENKNLEMEALKNENQFTMNQYEKAEFKWAEERQKQETTNEKLHNEIRLLEERRLKVDAERADTEQKAKLALDVKKQLIQTDKDVSFETLERIKAVDNLDVPKPRTRRNTHNESTDMEELIVTSKPKKASKTSKTRSSSILVSEKIAPIQKAEKVSKKKMSKAQSIEDKDGEEVVVVKKKKKSVIKKVSVANEAEAAENEGMGDLVEQAKPLKSTLTKKRSTLKRLTDLVTKSPILEPLRNRPKRGGSTLVKSGDAAANCSVIDLDSSIAVLSEKGNKEPVKAKKLVKKTSKLNLVDDVCENEENMEVESAPVRKTTRKKTKV